MRDYAHRDVEDVWISANKIVVSTLAPWVENVLQERFPAAWLNTVNSYRRSREQRDLVPRSDGTIPWDLSSLFVAILDVWPAIRDAILKQCNDSGINPREIRHSVEILVSYLDVAIDLRHRGAHTPAARFDDKDRNRFFDLVQHFLRVARLTDAADSIDDLILDRVQSRLAHSKAEFVKAEEMRVQPLIYEFLKTEIPNASRIFPQARSMMTRRIGDIDVPIPVAILAAGVPINLKPIDEKLFCILPSAIDDSYVRLRARAAKAENNATYTMKNIVLDGNSCTITGGLTDYFSKLATHHALEYELLSEGHDLLRANNLTLNSLIERMTAPRAKRAQFHRQARPEDKRRFSSLGISTTIISNTKSNGYEIFVGKRSDTTAVRPGLFHVIPSCSFQPELSIRDDWNIEHCVIKEFCEELYGEEVDGSRREHDYIYRTSDIARSLREALKIGDAELLHSGVVLDLMTFCSDICCVLFIHDPDWFARRSKPFGTNWEYMEQKALIGRHGAAGRTRYSLKHVEQQFLESFGWEDPLKIAASWSAEGLAAFWLGVEVANKYLQ